MRRRFLNGNQLISKLSLQPKFLVCVRMALEERFVKRPCHAPWTVKTEVNADSKKESHFARVSKVGFKRYFLTNNFTVWATNFKMILVAYNFFEQHNKVGIFNKLNRFF